MAELRARAEALERQLAETEQEARARVASAELKVEAVRAGIAHDIASGGKVHTVRLRR